MDDAARPASVGLVCGGRIAQWALNDDVQQAAMNHNLNKQDLMLSYFDIQPTILLPSAFQISQVDAV